MKIKNMYLFHVSGHSEYFFKNLLKGWEPGGPPTDPPSLCSDQFPSLTIFYEGFPKQVTLLESGLYFSP